MQLLIKLNKQVYHGTNGGSTAYSLQYIED